LDDDASSPDFAVYVGPFTTIRMNGLCDLPIVDQSWNVIHGIWVRISHISVFFSVVPVIGSDRLFRKMKGHAAIGTLTNILIFRSSGKETRACDHFWRETKAVVCHRDVRFQIREDRYKQKNERSRRLSKLPAF